LQIRLNRNLNSQYILFMTEKIVTQHPGGKKGVNIDKEKYEMIKATLLEIIKSNKEISYHDLTRIRV